MNEEFKKLTLLVSNRSGIEPIRIEKNCLKNNVGIISPLTPFYIKNLIIFLTFVGNS